MLGQRLIGSVEFIATTQIGKIAQVRPVRSAARILFLFGERVPHAGEAQERAH